MNDPLLANELEQIARGTAQAIHEAIDGLGAEAIHYAIDALYCALSNTAADLHGNTQDYDFNWYAQAVASRLQPLPWARLTDDERQHYLHVARCALDALPYLMDRIAARCRIQANAIRALQRADYLREQKGS